MVLVSQAMSRAVGSALIALVTATSIQWLWLFWTRRCNEACAEQTVRGMYGVLFASILMTVALVLMLLTGGLSVRRSLTFYVIGWTTLALCSVAVTPRWA